MRRPHREHGPQHRGSVTDRMRLQMAMKKVRAEARRLGITPEAYLAQVQRNALDETSETLARRIVDKALQAPPAAAPAKDPDLKDLVEQILRKDRT